MIKLKYKTKLFLYALMCPIAVLLDYLLLIWINNTYLNQYNLGNEWMD